MILDVHARPGGIVYEGGRSLIARTGVTKARVFDPVSISESMLRRDIGLTRALERRAAGAEQARNATATLENMTRSINEDGIDFRAGMPIPSHEPAARLR